MNYKAVIFDFNGTLFIDHDKHVIAWNEMSMLLRNKPLTEDELYNKINGIPNHKTIEYFVPGISEEDNKKYSLHKEYLYREACKKDLNTFCLVEGAYDYFNYLTHLNIPYTIASASIKENIDFFVESFQLDHYMNKDHIIYDNGTYINKVNMFKDASKVLGVDIQDCLIIEDSMSGIKHAYEAGCNQIIVMDSLNKGDLYANLPGVIQVIHSFKELL